MGCDVVLRREQVSELAGCGRSFASTFYGAARREDRLTFGSTHVMRLDELGMEDLLFGLELPPRSLYLLSLDHSDRSRP